MFSATIVVLAIFGFSQAQAQTIGQCPSGTEGLAQELCDKAANCVCDWNKGGILGATVKAVGITACVNLMKGIQPVCEFVETTKNPLSNSPSFPNCNATENADWCNRACNDCCQIPSNKYPNCVQDCPNSLTGYIFKVVCQSTQVIQAVANAALDK